MLLPHDLQELGVVDERDWVPEIEIELERLRGEMEAISIAGSHLKKLRADEIVEWSARIRRIRAELKGAARFGTVDRSRRPKTGLESLFFHPAVKLAAAHFHLRANARRDHWTSELSEPMEDIARALASLRKYSGRD